MACFDLQSRIDDNGSLLHIVDVCMVDSLPGIKVIGPCLIYLEQYDYFNSGMHFYY